MRDPACQELAAYRLEKAKSCLDEATLLWGSGKLLATASRSYYAIFHAIRAVLVLDALDFKKHSAVIAKFRELYIKTGTFDVVYSDLIGAAFDLWVDSDYEDFFLVTKEEIEEQLVGASAFIVAVESYLFGNSQGQK